MKRIISKHHRERKNRTNQIIVAGVLLFVMLFSTLGYAFQGGSGIQKDDSSDEVLTYNGLDFVYYNGFWILGKLSFRYNPEEVLNIIPSVDGLRDASLYQNIPLYVQSEDSDSKSEIETNMGIISSSVDSACLESESCGEGIPIISCDGTDKLIVIREGNSSSIRQDGNCVFIEGKSYELLQMTDRFLFEILGII
ncbi:MAG: hypothetical protein KKB79_02925 [Nanoarchaeota archaeon]|nr:hypothetical protein [Nanoarchaeota archaeon]